MQRIAHFTAKAGTPGRRPGTTSECNTAIFDTRSVSPQTCPSASWRPQRAMMALQTGCVAVMLPAP
jgi:hypothetical protein